MLVPSFTSYITEAFDHSGDQHAALLNHHDLDSEPHMEKHHEEAQMLTAHAKHIELNHMRGAQAYSGTISKQLNTSLIKFGTAGMYKSIHERMMSMHDSAKPLERDHHTYSSLGTFDPSTVMRGGNVFQTPAHTSTSLSAHVASTHANKRFQMDGAPGDHEHIVHFHLPAGFRHGTYIGHVSNLPHEHEVVIKPNTAFRMTGSETHSLPDGRKRTIWHAVPHESTLKEATYHDTVSFRNGSITSGIKTVDRGHSYIETLNNKRYALSDDVDAQHKRLMEHGPKWTNNEPYHDDDTHLKHIAAYTAASHGVNHALIKEHSKHPRTEHTEAQLKRAEHLSAAIQHHGTGLPEEVHTYSGVSLDHAEHLKKAAKVGGVVHTPAFTSTSIDPDRAQGFSAVKNNGGEVSAGRFRGSADRHILHFKLPKGYKKGVYVGHVSHASSERELLLDKGQHWKVAAHKVVSGSSSFGGRSPDGGMRSVVRHHIWTLEPHEHELKEATYHEPNAHRSFESSTTNFTAGTTTPNSERIGKFNKFSRGISSDLQDDVEEQHHKLRKIAPQLKEAHHTDDLDDVNEHNHHVGVLKNYTISSSSINRALVTTHNGHEPKHEETHKAAMREADTTSRAIEHHAKPLPKEMHVYSGTGSFDPRHAIRNDTLHLPAFTSTSLHPHSASNFAGGSISDNRSGSKSIVRDSHIIHFHLPKGYDKGVYVGHLSKYGSEETEFLMNKDQKWKVHGVKTTTQHYKEQHSGQIHKRRVHTWTVTPHDHDPLHETYTHDTDVFRGFTSDRLKNNGGGYSHYKTPLHQHYSDSSKEFHSKVEEHVQKHHEHMKSFGALPLSEHSSAEDRIHLPAITRYTSDSSDVNNHLVQRHANPHDESWKASEVSKELDSHAGKVSAAIQHHSKPLDHEAHVYSGLGHSGPKEAYENGHGVVHMPAFTSTSLHPGTALGFGRRDPRWKQGEHIRDHHIAHFKLPKGYNKGAYVDPVSSASGEHEYLMDKGQQWKVTGYEKVTQHRRFKQTAGKVVGTDSGASKVHIHIWTLEPHNEEPKTPVKEDVDLNEAYAHDPDYFSGTITYGKSHGHVGIIDHSVGGPFMKKSMAHVYQSSNKQHVNLRGHHKITDDFSRQVAARMTRDSREVNKALIYQSPMSFHGSDMHENSKLVREIISKHAKPLAHDTHVYSGTGDFDPSTKIGSSKVLHTPAFTSTSLNPAVALSFGPQNPNKDVHHILHFHLPKGYQKGLYVASHSHMKEEREMLLDHGQTWHVKGVKDSTLTIKHGHGLVPDKKKIKVRVWSLSPHGHPMNEAYSHDPNHPGFHSHDDASSFDFGGPFSADDHHDEHLALHSLHDSDHHDHVRHVENWSASSHDLNKHLITGGKHKIDDSVHELHGHMQHLMQTAKPLEKDHHVYSSFGNFNPSKKLTGADGHMKTAAYISTSLNPEVATMHSNAHLNGETHIAHFKLPAGYKGGRYIGGHSQYTSEHEMVLAPNQRFKKTGEHTVHPEPNEDGEHRGPKVIHTFEPVDHLKEAYDHDVSAFATAHPEGKSLETLAKEQGTHKQTLNNKVWNAASDSLSNLPDDHPTVKEHHELANRAVAYQEKHHPNAKKYERDLWTGKGFETRSVDEAIHRHTEGSVDLNLHLVDKHKGVVGTPYYDRMEETSANLSKAISHHAAPLERTTHVYSGTGSFNPANHFETHGHIETPAFTSTSITPHAAKLFMSTGDHDQHVIHFELPKGYNKGAYIGHHSEHHHEREFLLDKGQKWKLKGKTSVPSQARLTPTGEGTGKVVHTHIWTVVPHEDK